MTIERYDIVTRYGLGAEYIVTSVVSKKVGLRKLGVAGFQSEVYKARRGGLPERGV